MPDGLKREKAKILEVTVFCTECEREFKDDARKGTIEKPWVCPYCATRLVWSTAQNKALKELKEEL